MLLGPEPRQKSNRSKKHSLPSQASVASQEVLTKEMIATWKVRFNDVIEKMYAYDPKRGEQNR
jgi:hypothetical protein